MMAHKEVYKLIIFGALAGARIVSILKHVLFFLWIQENIWGACPVLITSDTSQHIDFVAASTKLAQCKHRCEI